MKNKLLQGMNWVFENDCEAPFMAILAVIVAIMIALIFSFSATGTLFQATLMGLAALYFEKQSAATFLWIRKKIFGE